MFSLFVCIVHQSVVEWDLKLSIEAKHFSMFFKFSVSFFDILSQQFFLFCFLKQHTNTKYTLNVVLILIDTEIQKNGKIRAIQHPF